MRFFNNLHWNLLLLVLAFLVSSNSPAKTRGVQQVWFYPETFLSSEKAISEMSSTPSGQAVTLPDSKAIYSPLMTPSQATQSASYGTYLIQLSPSSLGEKGVSLNINEAYKVYLIEGNRSRLLTSDGQLSSDPKQNSYRLVPYGSQEVYFQSQVESPWLLIHASAPRMEGSEGKSSLGIVKIDYTEASNIQLAKDGHTLYQTICFGVFILLFLYQLAIYLLRKEDYASLMIAVTALVFLMRSVAEEQVFALFIDNSDTLASFNSGIQFLRFVFLNAVSFLVSYFLIRSVFTKPFFITQTIMNSITVLVVGAVLLNPHFPGHVKEKALSGLTLVLLSSSLLSVWLFYRAMKKGVTGAVFGFVGYIIGPFLVSLDAMIILGKLDLFRVGTLGLVVLTFSFAMINGKQFSEAFRSAERLNKELSVKNEEIEEINKNLEVIVENRTRELKTIFHNIPQGVASLDQQGLISPQYSHHLEQVLEQKNLGQKSIFDVLFANSELSGDKIDQIRQTLASAVQEDILNFEINVGNLPLEIARKSAKGSSQWLALTWSPEADESNHVHSVLLTVEDVTDRRLLEQEAEKQRKDFAILQELVQCGAEKFDLFSRSSDQLLAENMRLLKLRSEDPSSLKIIFVNTHTVKGGARTLGLSGLAASLHEAENELTRILRKEVTIDHDLLQTNMNQCWQVFNRYITYNRDKLGRKSQGQAVNIDISFIKEHYRVLKNLEMSSSSSSSHFMEQIAAFRDKIAEFIYKSDTHIFESCVENAGKMAKDLGKLPPKIDLQTEDVPVVSEVEMVVRNAMVHILRNAIDHGIETAEERTIKGKMPEGKISIRTRQENDTIHIRISDDGRGLAIKKLKEKGVLAGLISENADIQTVAELIFQPGLSTAAAVSHISGRGVGMDAVKKFIEEARGSIQVQLLAEQGDHVPFALNIVLPLQDVQGVAA